MCGITGFIDFQKNASKEVLGRMVDTLKHRGPDDSGLELYRSECATIGLGQTRLSIIDLSPGGRQPMEFQNLAIVYNGEIYNYREIKKELKAKGHQFKSASDTEVILHAFSEWGPGCVERFIGMFAFVIYDSSLNKMYAFRDRAGVKPFYYYQKNGLFLFGSEMKAFHQHPSFEKEIDLSALRSYFDFGYIPAPYSIFLDVKKLEPGSYLEVHLQDNRTKIVEYWRAADYYKMPKFNIGYQEAKKELHSLLESSFRYRMVADVPVGVFLSGGYDSTAVAAILQSGMSQKLKTFTIGFEEGNNEAPFAKQTAGFLGTDHHELICTADEAQDIIPSLPYYYDEPFADSSAIPTMLVSRFAREHVTVALSADAGDELFAGYRSYPDLINKLKWMNLIPGTLKRPSATVFSGLASMTPDYKPALKHKLDGLSSALNRDRYKEAAELFRKANCLPGSYMGNMFSHIPDEYPTKFNLDTNGFHHETEIAMAVDYLSYLQNDILTKVDRATMSVSLEGRDPLVDHRLLEISARLPFDFKYDGRSTKRILKDIVHEYVPKEMMDRPKSGFSLPIYSWLRGDLSWMIDEYLNERELSGSGLFNVPFLLKQVELYKEDKLHYSPLIWKLLMFQMWYKKWMD